MIIATLSLAAASAFNCRVVTGDVIRMHDVAAAMPEFSRLDGESMVSYSPLPGSVRILQAAQLERLARRNGIGDGEFRDLCFQRAMRELDKQELLEAFHHAIGIPDAEVDLVDFSRFPAPVGDLVFPRSGLALTQSPGASFWKGYVIYGGGQHFSVWARVRVHAKLKRVVATDNLVTTRPVRSDQVRIEPLDGVPDALAPAQSLDDVVGKMLLRPVRKGATVSLDDVSTAVTVHRGDKVDVDLQSPVVYLRFEATAEMDGRMGDRVRLRNLQSKGIFEAEVTGKDRARVVVKDEANENENSHPGAALRLAGAGSGRQEEKGQQ